METYKTFFGPNGFSLRSLEINLPPPPPASAPIDPRITAHRYSHRLQLAIHIITKRLIIMHARHLRTHNALITLRPDELGEPLPELNVEGPFFGRRQVRRDLGTQGGEGRVESFDCGAEQRPKVPVVPPLQGAPDGFLGDGGGAGGCSRRGRGVWEWRG